MDKNFFIIGKNVCVKESRNAISNPCFQNVKEASIEFNLEIIEIYYQDDETEKQATPHS